MEDFKKIGNDVKNTIFDLYNKPSEGAKQDGLKGGLKGLGSAVGNVVEHCFTVPVDLTSSTYNLIKNKMSNENKNENNSDDKSSDDKSSNE